MIISIKTFLTDSLIIISPIFFNTESIILGKLFWTSSNVIFLVLIISVHASILNWLKNVPKICLKNSKIFCIWSLSKEGIFFLNLFVITLLKLIPNSEKSFINSFSLFLSSSDNK